MRTGTVLCVAILCAAPAAAQQASKTECRDLNGSNQFVGPNEVIVQSGSVYQVCHTVQSNLRLTRPHYRHNHQLPPR
jgi:hypothetical protein